MKIKKKADPRQPAKEQYLREGVMALGEFCPLMFRK